MDEHEVASRTRIKLVAKTLLPRKTYLAWQLVLKTLDWLAAGMIVNSIRAFWLRFGAMIKMGDREVNDGSEVSTTSSELKMLLFTQLKRRKTHKRRSVLTAVDKLARQSWPQK